MPSKAADSPDDLKDLLDEISKHVDVPDVSGKSAPDKTAKPPTTPVVAAGPPQDTNSTFPTAMSCSQAFNELVGCYSIGGQVRQYYRYGNLSQCEDKRKKFKFCLQIKLKSEKEQEDAIARFYRERLAEKRISIGSSEDVWTARKTKVYKPFMEHE